MMISRYTHTAIAVAAMLSLAACAAPHKPTAAEINTTYPATVQPDNVSSMPSHYRGTENGVAAVNSDAAINANVLSALSRLPDQGATNIQVSTYNAVVTMRGVTETSLIAQRNVETARQVPGVQRVDYDIQVRRP